jgi:acetyl esterase/lipase
MARLVRLLTFVLLLDSLTGCAPLTLLDSFTPHDTYRSVPNLAYGYDPRQRLDLYLPPTPLPGHPVLLFFYGGSWQRGERAEYRFVGEALASHGILTAVADYRLYPQVRYPAFLQDSALALHWLRGHAADYGGNPQRLYLAGHSAGAYNALMLALDPRWRGEVGDSGPETSCV